MLCNLKSKISNAIRRLLYITNARIPTEKAHGSQIIKMCEAFQRQGLQVELIVPFRIQSPMMKQVGDLWEYYEVEDHFQITHLFVPDFVPLGTTLPEKLMMALYYAQCLLFSTIAVFLSLFKRHSIYYTRDLQTVLLLCLTKRFHRKPVYFEAHELHGAPARTGQKPRQHWRSSLLRWMLHRIDGLIVITRQLKMFYAEMGVNRRKIMVAADGVDAKRLKMSINKTTARQTLHISLDRKLVCYTGHLFEWKGVYTLAESVTYLPEEYLIYIVGGREPYISPLKQFLAERHLQNVVLTGYVPYADVPLYLAAADLVTLPNSATARISREYTSPLKLFEYMGARRPIVASDLPSLREILRHEENACLVRPDDPRALAEGIARVMNDTLFAEQLVRTAFRDVHHYTWDTRAEKILEFFTRNT